MDSFLFNNENLARHQHPAPEQEITEVAEHVDGNQANNKRRKRMSKVWEEMTEEIRDGKLRAICKHCGRDFNGSSKSGTTHLKNHLESCRRKRNGGEDPDKSMKTSDVIEEKSLIDLIKNCFDEKGFPTKHWDPSVLNSRKVDILQTYEEEKEKLRRFFSQLSGRFSLKIEYVRGYYLLTVHYIDENWEPNCKIISLVNDNYGSRSVIATLKELCLDLEIDGNVCSIVYDCMWLEDDDVIGEISSRFTKQGALPFGHLPLEMDVFLKPILPLCSKYFDYIKPCVDYVNKTRSNRDKFQIAVDNVKSMGKKVTSDPFPTNGFSRADVKIALGYKEAFCGLEQIDPDFKTINLTKEEWDVATAVWELRNSLDNVCPLFETNSTRHNMYFSKICDVYVKFLMAERSAGYHLGQNTSPLIKALADVKQTFIDMFWSKYNLVLVIIVILDPRFKMDIVQLWFNKIYGCEADHYLDKIDQDFKCVYKEYAKGMETSSISYLDALGRPCTSSHNLISSKSELDRYLKEPKFPSVGKFDILAWWRLYSAIFPTLAQMARDFLVMPVCFDTLSCRHGAVFFINLAKELDDELQSALLYLLEL